MIEKHRLLGFVFGLVLVFSISGFGHADLVPQFESDIPIVPNGAIEIDGYASDWEALEIEPFLIDDEGDTTCDFLGTDIKSLYLARDTDFLYWRLDTVSGEFAKDVIDGYQQAPYFELTQQMDYEGKGYVSSFTQIIFIADPSSAYATEWVGGDHQLVEEAMLDGYVEAKETAEGMIPLDLDQITNYKIDEVILQYYRGGDNAGFCDIVSRTYTEPVALTFDNFIVTEYKCALQDGSHVDLLGEVDEAVIFGDGHINISLPSCEGVASALHFEPFAIDMNMEQNFSFKLSYDNFSSSAFVGGRLDLILVLSSFLCKFFIFQFLKEGQIVTHFPYRV